MGKKETIVWSEAIKIPSPDAILTIFWQIMAYFWKAEVDHEFYRTHEFPESIEDVRLQIEHRFYGRTRYHVLFLNEQEAAGIWDRTGYSILYQFPSPATRDYLEHGDPHHPYQRFMRSFVRTLKHYITFYPDLNILYKILSQLPILKWRCPLCKHYHQWAHEFIELQLLEHELSIAPSTLLFLLTHKNHELTRPRSLLTSIMTSTEMRDLQEILKVALHRFLTNFEKICEQTSQPPIEILRGLLTILEKHSMGHPGAEKVGDYEAACSREMKAHLFERFKFLKIKTVKVGSFPRDMMIMREIFPMIVEAWAQQYRTTDISLSTSSPGVILLLSHIIFPDHAIKKDDKSIPILFMYPSHDMMSPMIRHMTPPEIDQIGEYHPILRPFLFTMSS